MSNTSRQLVDATRTALLALSNERTSVDEDAAVATAAVLRQLSHMMSDAETDEDWPDADDLSLLADIIVSSL